MVYSWSRAGVRRQENQDVVCSGKNGRYEVISLADGVTSCQEARAGAEIASRAVTELFLRCGGYFLGSRGAETAGLALSHVLHELRCRAEADAQELREYSSTVSSVLYDRRTKRLLLFHLGDSLVIAAGGGSCRVLAVPSDSTGGCCVTTTRNAAEMAAVYVLEAGELETVFICSDGAWGRMFAQNRLRPEVRRLLAGGQRGALQAYLAEQETADDCSFISMELRRRAT